MNDNEQPTIKEVADGKKIPSGISFDLSNPDIVGVKTEYKESENEASFRRTKDLIGFIFALVVIGVFLWVLWNFISNPSSSPDDKKWAMGVLGAILGAMTAKFLGGNK